MGNTPPVPSPTPVPLIKVLYTNVHTPQSQSLPEPLDPRSPLENRSPCAAVSVVKVKGEAPSPTALSVSKADKENIKITHRLTGSSKKFFITQKRSTSIGRRIAFTETPDKASVNS